MPAGRPTKYNQDMLDQTREYIDSGYLDKENSKVIPSRVGLALCLGLSSSTIDNWGDDPDKTEFLGMLEEIHDKQHEILINSGLCGVFNANITKLALTRHGYADKSDNEYSGKGGEPLQMIFMGVPGNAPG